MNTIAKLINNKNYVNHTKLFKNIKIIKDNCNNIYCVYHHRGYNLYVCKNCDSFVCKDCITHNFNKCLICECKRLKIDKIKCENCNFIIRFLICRTCGNLIKKCDFYCKNNYPHNYFRGFTCDNCYIQFSNTNRE